MDEAQKQEGTEGVDVIKIVGILWQEGTDGPWKAQFRSLDIYMKAKTWKDVTEKLRDELNDIADNFEWELSFPDEGKRGDIVFSTEDHKYFYAFAIDRILKAK